MPPVGVETQLQKLLTYGPLGIIAVVLIFALITLFKLREKGNEDYQKQISALRDAHDKEMSRVRDEHNEELGRVRDEHNAEMKTLQERHIVKAENWNEKWAELSTKLNTVLESLVRQRERDSGYTPPRIGGRQG